MKRLVGFALLAALAIGCGKKDEDKPAPTPTDNPPVDTPPADKPADTPDQPAAADEELPTVEDFEEEAAGTITESNLEKELADLEKEIGD